MQFSTYSSCPETTLPESASLAKMSLFTASYMNTKHCMRPQGVQNILHFENTPNTSLQTRWKNPHLRSDLWEKTCALVTMHDSGFLNFRLLVMFVFPPWHFLIGRKIAVLLITASHHNSPTLVNHWENESRCRKLSLFYILLKASFPTQTTSIPSTAATTVSSRSNAFLVARFPHVWASRGLCPAASPRQPQLTCPLSFNKGLCAAVGETCLCHSRSSHAAKPLWFFR